MKYATLLGFILSSLLSLTAAPTPTPKKINCVSNATVTLLEADTCGRGGTAFVTHNGSGPITFIWSSNASVNNDTITGMPGGQIYTVQVRDTNGCLASDAIFVPLVSTFSATGFTTPDTCLNGNGSGGVLINDIVNGTPPYTFQWDANADSQTTPVATGLSIGSYLLSITDATGCKYNWLAQVDSTNNGFNVDFNAEDISCFGQQDGEAIAVPSGGNGDYSINWFDADSNQISQMSTNLSGLSQGSYFVSVQDGGGPGCRFDTTFQIEEPDTLTTGFLTQDAVGCTTPDGELTADASGGTLPYSYLWETGDTTETITGLAAGTYLLTVTDANGCTASINGLVSSEPGPFFTVDILQQDNCGLGEGIARVNVSQGTPPYLYDWSTNPPIFNDTSEFAYNLLRGSGYSVIVTGADSCVQIVSFNMPGNPPLQISNIDIDDSYCQLANGEARVNIQGGSAPYRYNWTTNPPQTAPVAQNLDEGIYAITVRDSFNCTLRDTIQILDEPGFVIELDHVDESCFGKEDGSAEVRVGDARGNVSYTWNTEPPQRGPSISRLSAGIYEVEVVDIEGCTRADFVSIESEDFLRAGFQAQPDTLTPVVLSSATFQFENTSQGGSTYVWDFGDGSRSSEFNPSHTYADTGSYFVQLKTFNEDSSCVDSILLGPYVVSPDGSSLAPNAFTPNQDGINDFFEIKGRFLENFSLVIYNRWGVAVFESNNPRDSWNGNLQGERPAPMGVYIYHLQADVPGGKEINELGTLTLIR